VAGRAAGGTNGTGRELDEAASDDSRNRRPSTDRKGNFRLGNLDHGASGQFLASLEIIKKSIMSPNTNSYYVFCLKPNDRRIANQFDSKCVRAQVQTLGIVEISQRLRNADFSIFLPFGEFLGLAHADSVLVGSERENSQAVLDERRWPANEAQLGATGVFLSERCWASIAQLSEMGFAEGRFYGAEADNDGMLARGNQGGFGDSRTRLLPGHSPPPGAYDSKNSGYFGSREVDTRSDVGSAFNAGDMFRNLDTREQMAEKGNEKKMVEVEDVVVPRNRKRWLVIVYLLTFYIPDFLIKWIGRMPRKDVRTAWREKLAINLLIWFSCLFVIFFMIGLPMLICPKQYVFSPEELSSFNGQGSGAYTSIRGVVIDLGEFAPTHYPKNDIIPTTLLNKFAGTDATDLFPVQVSALCAGSDLSRASIDPSVTLNANSLNVSGSVGSISATDLYAKYHDFRYNSSDGSSDYRPDWFSEQMMLFRQVYKKGYVGYSPSYVATLANAGRAIAIKDGRIYDFTDYQNGGRQGPADQVNFMDQTVANLFEQGAGTDVSKMWEALPLAPELRQRMSLCLDNLFFIGAVDTRNSVQCLFAKYILLAVSLLLTSVIGFKFFAALQFGKKKVPEHLDKFIICQVPAYTEDEDSLRRAIDSAARMKYDDKRKLLVIICDGMIIGQGNDRPTPRIVLDILGVSDTVDPEPLSFESLGEGMKQHNMGKIYSGLYEVQGHIVPFLVVVKIGKPSEVSRPGNRGKRDSQMLLMRFLNRVHYNLPMNPLELEIHHQIRNIIGVNPTFYEFMLQIDADTVVAADSATRMVSAFIHDSKLIGICGETALSNAKSSFITMIQVYEYYISHNLTKAFESLFGSVTCLPGCFTMYRIRAPETGKPLFVSKDVCAAYSNIRVDTLHMKNLLHLGEDRYLTTLLLKYHPKYKTKYTFHAHAWTVAPDSWAIFMSQRRRWINSTVHNLMELIPLQQLCGFCCFSMRFVVFIDLLSTIIQPVTVFYVVYLIVVLVISPSVIPQTALILLIAIYGLQAVIFILRRKWEMIGWMVLYVLAMPVFSLGLPLYAFWHMDDFTWGNTRVVTGEKGRQIVITDEGRFDPASIPRKKWEDYQSELWDAQTQADDRSEVSGISYATRSFAGAPSEHGGYRPASRAMSQMEMPRHGSRMSLAPSELMRGGHADPMDAVDLSSLPTEDALLAEMREILKTADLMTVTKKSIKLELEARFGVGLDAQKAYIGSGEFWRRRWRREFGLVLTCLQLPRRSSRGNCEGIEGRHGDRAGDEGVCAFWWVTVAS
jgi:chitin synthase